MVLRYFSAVAVFVLLGLFVFSNLGTLKCTGPELWSFGYLAETWFILSLVIGSSWFFGYISGEKDSLPQ
jgi:hypothetical protein